MGGVCTGKSTNANAYVPKINKDGIVIQRSSVGMEEDDDSADLFGLTFLCQERREDNEKCSKGIRM